MAKKAGSMTTQQMVEALNNLEQIQASNGVVEQVVLHGRVTTSGVNNVDPITGRVVRPTFEFFAGTAGQSGNGFGRQLTRADLNDWVQNNETVNNVAFLGLRSWFWFSSAMPIVTMQRLTQYGFAYVKRLNLEFEIGRPLDWPSGPRGVQVAAAASTFAADRILFPTNGLLEPRDLAKFGRWLLPANNQFRATLVCETGDLFATTDGLPLGINNALIPNNGDPGEDAGIFEFCIEGLKWSAIG